MPDKSFEREKPAHGSLTNQSPSAGPDGAAISPPNYGIKVLDEGSAQVIVQKKESATAIQTAAGAGVEGSGKKLPYFATIQKLFGKHDIREVQAYTNTRTAAASRAIGAAAYATGSKVAFARPDPDLHTVAHEAAHVIQQKGEVQLKDGVGEVGDRYERQANAIADWVTQGKPVEDQLDRFNPGPNRKGRQSKMSTVVQRRMGIEAELSVPISIAPTMPVPTDDQKIRAFLSGGIPERTLLAPPNQGFKKVTDHDKSLADEVEQARQQLDTEVQNHAHPPIPAAPNLVANMEYVTDNGGTPPAYDERDATERQAFRQSILTMAMDMNTVFANAQAGVQPLPGVMVSAQYGLPPVAEWQNFATTNGLSQDWGTNTHAAILSRIKDELHMQISIGIVPRRIGRFYGKLSKDKQLESLAGTFPSKAADNAWVKLLTSDAATAADQAVSHTQGLTKDVHNSKSLRGLVSLMMAYIFGLFMTYRRIQSGTRPLTKNLVAALPRTPLTNVLRELDVTKRPDQWNTTERNSLLTEILQAATNRLDRAPVNRVATDDSNVNALVSGTFDWLFWVDDVLNNLPNADVIYTWLGGTTQIDPLDHPRSKTINPVIGSGLTVNHPRPHPPVGTAPVTAKSGAVVFELRHIKERPRPGQLLALVDRAIKLAREAND